LLASSAVIGAIGGTAAADAEPVSVGELGGLSDAATDELAQRRALAAKRVEAASTTAVAPEDCRTDSGDLPILLRYAGANRYETAVCVSYGTWFDHDDPEVGPESKADVVVLARGDAFPDALAGGPLAAYAEGPLLLTPPTSLPSAVKTEIQRVLAPGGLVYLLGGTGSVSNGIRDELQAAGYATERLSGPNRFETAIAIADELPDTSNFFFVTGQDFPDALGAGAAAAALSLGAKLDLDPETRPFALLLTNGDVMPASTFNFVDARGQQFGVWTLVTSGGAADRAAAAAFGSANLAARFAGPNRYATATLIAETIFTDPAGVLVGAGAGIATGENFPDALGATASLAIFGEPLLLTSQTQLSAPTRTFLESHAGEGDFLDVFGGTGTISSTIASQAAGAFAP
jgi:hypothetical protein